MLKKSLCENNQNPILVTAAGWFLPSTADKQQLIELGAPTGFEESKGAVRFYFE
jgi:hypothetical protein